MRAVECSIRSLRLTVLQRRNVGERLESQLKRLLFNWPLQGRAVECSIRSLPLTVL